MDIDGYSDDDDYNAVDRNDHDHHYDHQQYTTNASNALFGPTIPVEYQHRSNYKELCKSDCNNSCKHLLKIECEKFTMQLGETANGTQASSYNGTQASSYNGTQASSYNGTQASSYNGTQASSYNGTQAPSYLCRCKWTLKPLLIGGKHCVGKIKKIKRKD
ncbi:hypothetical protein niasHT_036328 [Heterodera trifolii]|uniref:Uncharacterized protein n=1 Tax=Heterodera trifolii TaxID=157864 RepID=A0ABD2J5E0_9BILA